MRNILFIAILFLSTFCHSQEEVAEQVNIPFTLTPNDHIIITATVNGTEGQFVFDTGAGLNLLTKKFADQVKNLEKTYNFYTGHRATGEAIESDLWIAESLKIGSFRISDENFAVYDLEFPLDGLISLTPFEDKQVTIDFTNKMLRIESEKSYDRLLEKEHFEIPLQVSSNRDVTLGISTKIELGDTLALTVSLDSGAGFGVYRFNSRYMEHLGIDSTQVASEYRSSYFKPEEGNTFYYAEVSELSDIREQVEIEDFKATFIEGLIHEGIMGINWIGEIITIDMPNERLIVQQ